MKKILFKAVFILMFFNMAAQNIPPGENISLDQQLSNVNQTSVTSGIIYERTLQLANLYNFNKRENFKVANYNYFKQSLLEMNNASNGAKFISVDDLKNRMIAVKIQLQPHEVYLGILNTQFHILNYNEDNPSAGGLTFNTGTQKFEQISGRDPFFMMHNTVIAPLKNSVSGANVVYKISNNYNFTNGTKTIKSLIADFGDGINRTIINNGAIIPQNITVNYSASGEKESKYTITYQDNSTLITHSKIYFENTAMQTQSSCNTTNTLTQDFSLQSDIPFTGYNPGDPSIKAKINYRIFYGNNNSQMLVKKPIIIIDGFDPGDKRKIQDCDCEQNSDCVQRNSTTEGVFDPTQHKSMVDMMTYFENGVPKNLLPTLRALNYDVIIVNLPTYTATNLLNGAQVTIDGGAYYIESNALAVVKLISNIRQQLINNSSTNQIAIVAPSMAGQISKYALSYMEKNNIPHNTYLWISVDSPHLGANVPMGDQAMLNLVRSSSDEAQDFYRNELSSPASQQLLLEFHRSRIDGYSPVFGPLYNYNQVNSDMLNAQTISQGMPYDRGNSMFQQHYNNQFSNGLPNSQGWPQNTRKIAIINGSLTGSKSAQALNGQPIMNFANDNEKVLNLRGFQRVNIDLPWPLGSITFRVHIASLEADFMPSYGNHSQIARFKKGFNNKTTQAPNINWRGVMDNTPGGYFDAQLQLFDSTTENGPVPGTPNFGLSHLSFENIFSWVSSRIGGDEWYLHEFNPIHSFIPTFSALGYLEPNQSWATPVNTNLSCPSNRKTPFDSYFGLANNTQHTSFTKESVAWLLKELDNQPQAPWYPINDAALTGPDYICLNADTIYGFSNPCDVPSAVTWSVDGNLQITSSSNYSVTVQGIENGEGWIVATFQNGLRFQKRIWTGSPVFSEITFGGTAPGQSLCIAPNSNFEYSIPELNSSDKIIASFNGMTAAEKLVNSNWQWQTMNNLIYLNGSKNSRSICTMGPGQTSISVRAKNACGWSDWFDLPFEITELPWWGERSVEDKKVYEIYPNPSDNMVTIDLRDKNIKPIHNETILGELFDLMGLSKSKVEIVNNKATFYVTGLNTGVYVLKIYVDGKIESHQIAVK